MKYSPIDGTKSCWGGNITHSKYDRPKYFLLPLSSYLAKGRPLYCQNKKLMLQSIQAPIPRRNKGQLNLERNVEISHNKPWLKNPLSSWNPYRNIIKTNKPKFHLMVTHNNP